MKDTIWPVAPLCDAQLLDVDPDDVLCGGLYRRCNTYKGGGGYDQFPAIYERRFGVHKGLNDQFVVQLCGCPLRCPYCYVTEAGVRPRQWAQVMTSDLLAAFRDSGCEVFHLMGGAPALYVERWHSVIEGLRELEGCENAVFHSDLLLVEKEYDPAVIRRLASFGNQLHAVSVKGSTPEEFEKNTRTPLDEKLFWWNLDVIVSERLPFYFTFTGMPERSIECFREQVIKRYRNPSLLDDAFAIELVHYKALDYKEGM